MPCYTFLSFQVSRKQCAIFVIKTSRTSNYFWYLGPHHCRTYWNVVKTINNQNRTGEHVPKSSNTRALSARWLCIALFAYSDNSSFRWPYDTGHSGHSMSWKSRANGVFEERKQIGRPRLEKGYEPSPFQASKSPKTYDNTATTITSRWNNEGSICQGVRTVEQWIDKEEAVSESWRRWLGNVRSTGISERYPYL